MRVYVLGCGPAGLFASHAAIEAGHQVTILSKARKSHMYGAQYLHRPIPGLGGSEPVMLDYRLVGNAEDYATKVYGEVPIDFVSPDKLVGQHPAWNIRRAYEEAWVRYSDRILNATLSPATVMGILDRNEVGLIISTVPAPALCYQPERHSFVCRDVWAIGDAPDRDVSAPKVCPPNTVICDGTRDVGWYRASNIFGFNTVEWPEDRKPPIENVARISKPVRTNCDCYQDSGRVWRAGRFGTWQKGYLSHQAYFEIQQAFKGLS